MTTEFDQAAAQVAPSLAALEQLAAEGVQVILTYPNNDAGRPRDHRRARSVRGARDCPALQVHRSLGRHLYHGVLALARDPAARVACVGNSSSGIKETPAFGCPTVNIGSRQDGRLRGENVIDVGYDAARDRCRDPALPVRRSFPRALPRGGQSLLSRRRRARRSPRCWPTVPLDQKLLRKRMTLTG